MRDAGHDGSEPAAARLQRRAEDDADEEEHDQEDGVEGDGAEGDDGDPEQRVGRRVGERLDERVADEDQRREHDRADDLRHEHGHPPRPRHVRRQLLRRVTQPLPLVACAVSRGASGDNAPVMRVRDRRQKPIHELACERELPRLNQRNVSR